MCVRGHRAWTHLVRPSFPFFFHSQMSLSVCLSPCAITNGIQAAACFPGTGETVGCLHGRVSQRWLSSSTWTKTFAWFGATWHNPVKHIFASHFSPWQRAQKACCHRFSPRTLRHVSYIFTMEMKGFNRPLLDVFMVAQTHCTHSTWFSLQIMFVLSCPELIRLENKSAW